MSNDNNEQEQDQKDAVTISIGEARASIAALDLPLEYAGNIQTFAKSQSTPNTTNSSANKSHQEDYESNDDLPPKGVLHRAHSLDSGKEKIVSVPTIEEIRLFSNDSHHSAIKEEVVVPARDVLIKMPFYSTPLTIEATNNAFRDFMVRLHEMGFVEEAEAALVATNAESVEAAVEFIMNHADALYHRFTPKLNEEQDDDDDNSLSIVIIESHLLCALCGLSANEHIINSKGDKIEQMDAKEGEYGDLNGRISMSIDTKRLRQQQKNTLEDIIQQRVKMVQSIAEEAVEEEEEKTTHDTNDDERKEEKDTDANAAMETCSICFVDRKLDMFYRAVCGHNYCKVCLQTHYKIKTKDGDVLKLSCIDPKCKRLIEEDEILNFLIDEDIKKKFVKFRQNKLMQLNPNARFCCKPDCEGRMIGSRINRKLICPLCHTAVCFNCSQPWHGLFVGCNQNVDIGYTKWALNKDVQKCPKCRMGIEKDDGCNHMTCTSCKYEFCWICKGPYNDHHFEWWNIFGCPGAQYTPRFCRCPICFPRWMNRILIILCFLAVVVPIVIVAGVFWFVIVCLIFCIRCEFKCDIDPCDCF